MACSSAIPGPIPEDPVHMFSSEQVQIGRASYLPPLSQSVEGAPESAMDVDSPGAAIIMDPRSPGSNSEDSDLTLLHTLLELAATKRQVAARHCEKFTEMLEQTVSASPSSATSSFPQVPSPTPSPSSRSRTSLDAQSQLYYKEDQHPLYSVQMVPTRRHHRSVPRRSHDGALGRRRSKDMACSHLSSPSLATSAYHAPSPFLLPSPPASCGDLSSSIRTRTDGYTVSTPTSSASLRGNLLSPPMYRKDPLSTCFSSPFAPNPIRSKHSWSRTSGQSRNHSASSAPYPCAFTAHKATSSISCEFSIPYSTSLPTGRHRPETSSSMSPTDTGRNYGAGTSPFVHIQQYYQAPLASQSSGGFTDTWSKAHHGSSRRRNGLDLPRSQDGMLVTSGPPQCGRGEEGVAHTPASSLCCSVEMMLRSCDVDGALSAAHTSPSQKGQRCRRLGLDLARDEVLEDVSPEKKMETGL